MILSRSFYSFTKSLYMWVNISKSTVPHHLSRKKYSIQIYYYNFLGSTQLLKSIRSVYGIIWFTALELFYKCALYSFLMNNWVNHQIPLSNSSKLESVHSATVHGYNAIGDNNHNLFVFSLFGMFRWSEFLFSPLIINYQKNKLHLNLNSWSVK